MKIQLNLVIYHRFFFYSLQTDAYAHNEYDCGTSATFSHSPFSNLLLSILYHSETVWHLSNSNGSRGVSIQHWTTYNTLYIFFFCVTPEIINESFIIMYPSMVFTSIDKCSESDGNDAVFLFSRKECDKTNVHSFWFRYENDIFH